MEFGLGLVVLAEDHADIDSAKRVDLQANPADAELGTDPVAVGRVATTHEDVGAVGELRGVLEQNDIESGAPQLASGDASQAHTVGAVQHFDHAAIGSGRDGIRMALDLVGARPEPERSRNEDEGRKEPRGDQAESATGSR